MRDIPTIVCALTSTATALLVYAKVYPARVTALNAMLFKATVRKLSKCYVFSHTDPDSPTLCGDTPR